MSEFLYATLNAAREIIPLLAMREEHLLQAGAKGAGGDISIGADLLCEEIFTKHLSHIGHIDSEESGFIAAGTQMDSNKDFSDKAQTLSSRDLRQQVVAIHKSTQIDCHADKSARNDSNNAPTLKQSAQDSRIFDNKAPSVSKPQATAKLDSSKSPSDSKILDEKCGLQGKSQGSYLDGNDRRDFSPLPHFSLKAESPQAQKPTPKPQKRLAL